jgi:hypothetical protein
VQKRIDGENGSRETFSPSVCGEELGDYVALDSYPRRPQMDGDVTGHYTELNTEDKSIAEKLVIGALTEQYAQITIRRDGRSIRITISTAREPSLI